jgi:formylglycine-generating enzyme required for sulfatase activity
MSRHRSWLRVFASSVAVCAVVVGVIRCAARGPTKATAGPGLDESGPGPDGPADAGGMDVAVDAVGESSTPPPPSCARCGDGWCPLPSGTFSMGAAWNEPARAAVSEDPVTVTLTHAFEISQYEITVADWTAAGLTPSQPMESIGCGEPACPAYATWYDALAYANIKSRTHNPPLAECYRLTGCTADGGSGMFCTGATETAPLYDCPGYRIPTEAEWEYACRAGSTTAFYDGDFTRDAAPPVGDLSSAAYDEPSLDSIAWYSANSGHRAHVVGGKAPNGFCLYDMLGNIDEWSSGGYNGQSYGPSPQTDPGAQLGTFLRRSSRGGPYNGWPALDDCYERSGWGVSVPAPGVGVRLVRTLDIPQADR